MTDKLPAREMPQYLCHKKVRALQIKSLRLVSDDSGEFWLHPVETWYAPFLLDRAYIEKHAPAVGGYYVVYEDGYKSWLPATAFESGYSLLSEEG